MGAPPEPHVTAQDVKNPPGCFAHELLTETTALHYFGTSLAPLFTSRRQWCKNVDQLKKRDCIAVQPLDHRTTQHDSSSDCPPPPIATTTTWLA
jgi:hypothetical protein